MPTYITASQRYIATSRELGKGGEGIVYEVSGCSDQVAKIYHPSHRTLEKEQKLQAMIANPPQDEMCHTSPPHISIAWPLELLYDQQRFVGYLMPCISQSPNIFEIYNPQSRVKNHPAFDWRYLHRTAKNFATALNALHARGYVMGDVNQKNVLVTTSALVTLVDTDSFQVTDSNGRIYRCPVGVPEYIPPELQGSRLDTVDRATHHDNFGLAVIIFQLLMEGFHPFTGAPKDPMLSLGGETHLHCIKQGIFPYQSNNEFTPPPGAPDFSILHPEIQKLSLRCFVNGHLNPASRPTAREWLDALNKAERALVRCSQNPAHWYSNHTNKCYWCERERQKLLPIQQGLPSIPTPPRHAPVIQPPQPATPAPTLTLPGPVPAARALQLATSALILILKLFFTNWWKRLLPILVAILFCLVAIWGPDFLPLSGITALAAGRDHTCASTEGGGVKCWGDGHHDQLGDGMKTDHSTPVNVIGLMDNITALAAGNGRTCALTADGGVKCWGMGTGGQHGDGTQTDRDTSVDVVGLTSNVTALAAGDAHTCALTADGGVKCWGDNYHGQLGYGTQTTGRGTPVDVVGLTSNVTALVAGDNHTCALTVHGGVKCWGYNYWGQLGDGTQTDRDTPVDVVGLTSNVTALAAGDGRTCALTADGGVKCWGMGTGGQQGDGTWINRGTPVDVVGLASNVTALAAGNSHTCALTADGGVKCWGENGDGQLGDGTWTDRDMPVDVVGLTSNVTALAAGSTHTCALTVDGGVKCWGWNGDGQLGDGSRNNRCTPVNVRSR